jgi:phosphonate metabolism protein PhnN/1,5-bisphosphokinase (PRPP-forming)
MKIILIVGPSGAGKDSLLSLCQKAFAGRDGILFIPRYVTRMPDDNERNYYLDQSAFNTLKQSGFFFIDWQAHGNCYGIGLDPLLRKDKQAVIISVSRTVIGTFEQFFDDVETIFISAPESVLSKRLARRARESGPARDSRLARKDLQVIAGRISSFNNDGPLEQTAPRFIELMEHILSSPSPYPCHEKSEAAPGTSANGMHSGKR